jgi:hypothetical protein
VTGPSPAQEVLHSLLQTASPPKEASRSSRMQLRTSQRPRQQATQPQQQPQHQEVQPSRLQQQQAQQLTIRSLANMQQPHQMGQPLVPRQKRASPHSSNQQQLAANMAPCPLTSPPQPLAANPQQGAQAT